MCFKEAHGFSRSEYHGSKHSWWGNADTGNRTAIPRHTEIDNNLAKKICKDLGIPRL